MKKIKSMSLLPNQKKALEELKHKILIKFSVKKFILFGSFARFESDNESDIDLLIITNEKYDRPRRHKITDLVFKINLKYDTNISTIVIDEFSWEKGPISVLPIKEEIKKEGILL
jgi:predicted nucleotidyltransferase